MLHSHRPTVSIVIKALNEEKNIALAIESALAALNEVDGEIILADGQSTDRTVEIARSFPIKIVQLSDVSDQSCGAGAQLGFQHSRGQYICLIDGDMTLRPGFLTAAIRHLVGNAVIAGVGGVIVENESGNQEFMQRARRDEPDRRPGRVTRLDCGGVFRRSAIESVGYLTDRNLDGCEELELGARLRARGWILERIAMPAIDHRGHSGNAYRLLWRRISSRMAFGIGESLRAALGRPHCPLIFERNNTLKLCMFMHGWWASLIACMLLIDNLRLALLAVGGMIVFPIAGLALRWRSLNIGLYSFAAWNVYAICFLPGLLRRRRSPTAWIDSVVVKDEQGQTATAHLQVG